MMGAIIFDCFGVLAVDPAQAFVGCLPASQQAAANTLVRVFDTGHLSRSEFRQAMHDLTGQRPHYADNRLVSGLHKNTGLLAYIADLKPRYKIGLLSNIGTNWVREKFLTAAELALFDTCVFSFEVGLAKPDERVYHLIADRLDQPPGSCVLIDDSERNCQGAADMGMQTIVYHSDAQLRHELQTLLAA